MEAESRNRIEKFQNTNPSFGNVEGKYGKGKQSMESGGKMREVES